jgi:hypothetical protein
MPVIINHGENKSVWTVMVNNSANIKKKNNYLSTQISEVLTQKRLLCKENYTVMMVNISTNIRKTNNHLLPYN